MRGRVRWSLGISYMDPERGNFRRDRGHGRTGESKKTGQGQLIDQSQLETAVSLMGEGLMHYEITGKEPKRQGNHDRVMAPHEITKPGDADKWVSIAVGSEEEWRSCAL